MENDSINGDRSLMHLPCAFDETVFLSNCPGDVALYRFDGSNFLLLADDDAHDVCFIVVAIFVDGTEFLFGKEALPLALPIIRYHCYIAKLATKVFT